MNIAMAYVARVAWFKPLRTGRFSARPLIRTALLALLLCAAAALPAAGEPAVTAAELDAARTALARIQAQQRELGARENAILLDEQRLDARVQQLKRQPSGLPDSLQQVRLDRALRQLRDRLVELEEVRRQQRQSSDSETHARERVAELLRVEATQRLADAEQAFTTGREEEANALYRRSLELMRESDRMAHAPIPAMGRDLYDFDPALTGSEGADELDQISVLLRHEAEEMGRELDALDQLARRLQSDLDFERRAARFQGIREREADATTEPPAAVGRAAKLEGRLAEVQERIVRYRARQRHFLQRADELEALAVNRQRRSGEPGR